MTPRDTQRLDRKKPAGGPSGAEGVREWWPHLPGLDRPTASLPALAGGADEVVAPLPSARRGLATPVADAAGPPAAGRNGAVDLGTVGTSWSVVTGIGVAIGRLGADEVVQARVVVHTYAVGLGRLEAAAGGPAAFKSPGDESVRDGSAEEYEGRGRRRGSTVGPTWTDTSKCVAPAGSSMTAILQGPRDLATHGVDVATTGPVAALLLVLGTLLMVFAIGFFGALSTGAVLSALTR